MTFLAGLLVIEIKAGAPNNGRGEDNVAMVKSTRVGSHTYPYVSAQALRRWWRDSLPVDEPRSPVYRSGKGTNQQAYTAGRADKYLDDDLFGYMIAVKDDSYNRDTVLAVGTAVAVAPRVITRDFGTMSRGFEIGANPVIHEHQHYTADVASPVMLDLPRVGTFEYEGRGNRPDMPPEALEEARAAGAVEVEFRDTKAIRLPMPERRRRVAVLLRTLAQLRGGAKQSLHYGERSPALVVLAPTKGGNNPFTRVVTHDAGATVVDTAVLREEIAAWSDELDGPVLLGWAPGFLRENRSLAREELADLIDDGTVRMEHPRVLLRGLAEEIESGEHDMWFEDAA
ncbi:type I-B CRISPR-associated protein Cas7/Cst2/DevR [Saccharopolyspora subtropica]|uniref:Type I-B CRISPR-associated protein Cas7/Cst2/DevR n=1 Tax=Saccharopolyspora thermophila TaxID=89367 RepID=A0A917NF87_9PSEU|nr:type I-B CRISPR-associated protein Cas7/Cst2/DevR [Saccharopolyspora subtropica]GGI95170.1 type I-B CRISPR-associated protein Cas7/Cst2/DevR [Saccharopolyspora subtropica]